MRRLLIVASLAVVWPSVLAGQQRVPDVALEVTVRQREQGKVERGLHVLELKCFDGRCALTSISLNQCAESGEGKPAFYPKVQRSSTSDGNLVVSNEGRTLIVRETGSDLGGDYVNNFRFEYALPASGRSATELLGFSGGFVKDSAILGKVIAIEYVPLPKAFQVLPLDCGALLPGVGGK
jgi:hypothetical protein